MSTKRPLTDEEIRMAARLKAAIAAVPNLTEEQVGHEVGVSQGQVSHWTNGRLPVPAKRARRLAEILGIANPGEISTAYRDATGTTVAMAGRPSQSLTTRLDPAMLAEIHMAFRLFYERRGEVFSLEREPELFVQALTWYAELPEKGSTQRHMVLGGQIQELVKGADVDGRGKGVPDARGTGTEAGNRGRNKA